jgi:hypothetical protein
MLDKATIEELNQYPELCERVKQLFAIIKNAEGETTLADVAEQRVIDEMRVLGHAVLQNWANQQADKAAQRAIKQKASLRKHTKKN